MALDDDPTPPPAPFSDEPESRPGGLPLYVWVIGAVILAVPTGMALGADGSWYERLPARRSGP